MAGTSLGAPIATVKLVKLEIISEKTFREDLAKLETSRGKAMTSDVRA
jgi:hypothetical protein